MLKLVRDFLKTVKENHQQKNEAMSDLLGSLKEEHRILLRVVEELKEKNRGLFNEVISYRSEENRVERFIAEKAPDMIMGGTMFGNLVDFANYLGAKFTLSLHSYKSQTEGITKRLKEAEDLIKEISDEYRKARDGE